MNTIKVLIHGPFLRDDSVRTGALHNLFICKYLNGVKQTQVHNNLTSLKCFPIYLLSPELIKLPSFSCPILFASKIVGLSKLYLKVENQYCGYFSSRLQM